MIQVDEAKLNYVDRLGLAYCRLNCFEWDEILGDKPAEFDNLPDFPRKRLFQRKMTSKQDYVYPAIIAIEAAIGVANTSRCWWLFQLGKTEREWMKWYIRGVSTGKIDPRLN